uniref:Uncharacterized protein n=1 Tax=Steinernema glaseri TaxID=37863 RepID=A0A1I7Y3E3_9BILA
MFRCVDGKQAHGIDMDSRSGGSCDQRKELRSFSGRNGFWTKRFLYLQDIAKVCSMFLFMIQSVLAVFGNSVNNKRTCCCICKRRVLSALLLPKRSG